MIPRIIKHITRSVTNKTEKEQDTLFKMNIDQKDDVDSLGTTSTDYKDPHDILGIDKSVFDSLNDTIKENFNLLAKSIAGLSVDIKGMSNKENTEWIHSDLHQYPILKLRKTW